LRLDLEPETVSKLKESAVRKKTTVSRVVEMWAEEFLS
jgi:hypothetical protein